MFDKYRTKRELKRLINLLPQEKDENKINEIKLKIKYCELLRYADYKLLFK